MGVQERRAREKKELRQEILDAARHLFVQDGFENVSMRKIAERIEYSPTTIYLYFKDKAELLDCICEETLELLVQHQSSIVHTAQDPVERLRRALRAYIEFGLKHPNHYRVSFMMIETTEESERIRARAMGEKAFEQMRHVLNECSVEDPETSAQTLWATIHGLTSLLIAKPRFRWVEREHLIDTLVDGAIRGLRYKSR